MKKAVRLCAFLTALVICAAAFAACGGGGKTGKDDPKPITGETYNVGSFTVLVPEGWLAVPEEDVLDSSETNPNTITILKDAKSKDDAWDSVGVKINYFSPDTTYVSAKDWYDDVVDIDPAELEGLSDFTWTGFSGSFVSKQYVLVGEKDGMTLQVAVFAEMGNKQLSYDDPAVLAIVKSIKIL